MSPPILDDILHLSLNAHCQGCLDTKALWGKEAVSWALMDIPFFLSVVTQVLASFMWEKV